MYVRVHRCVFVECMKQSRECHSVCHDKFLGCQTTSVYARVHRCVLIECTRQPLAQAHCHTYQDKHICIQ